MSKEISPKDPLKSFRARIALGGFLKALTYGLIAGFGCMLVFSLLDWIFEWKLFWVSILIGAGVLLVVKALLFFVFFRSTEKGVAKRVDDLGLKERVITMHELQGDDSVIARLQREDTLAHLNTVKAEMISIVVAVPLIVAATVLGVCGVGLTVVSALSADGVVPPIGEIIPTEPPVPVSYEVEYTVQGEGLIEGEIFQNVLQGEDATPVHAEAEDGWVFVGWLESPDAALESAGGEPDRVDLCITSDRIIVAVFMESDEDDSEQEDQDAENGAGEEDDASDTPNDSPQQEPQQQPNPNESQTSGGSYTDNDKYLNNNAYYEDFYDQEYNQAVDELSNNDEVDDDTKDFVGDYYHTIGKGKKDN